MEAKGTLTTQRHTTNGGINRQVVLPFRKSLDISIKSLKVRFFRSLITVATLVLAVAFLAFVMTSAAIARDVCASGDEVLRMLAQKAGFDTATGATGPKERWIVFLSLLVCTVGIVNAQLMAVTERFREIGTMKCLGALDSFILRLFVMEAALVGAAGALVGSITGSFFAVVNAAINFGLTGLSHVHYANLLLQTLVAAGTGLALSLLGVLYPAIVAARMQPVEAMRAEE